MWVYRADVGRDMAKQYFIRNREEKEDAGDHHLKWKTYTNNLVEVRDLVPGDWRDRHL